MAKGIGQKANVPIEEYWKGGRLTSMASVVRRDGESIEGLLKRFRKSVQRERILSTVRRRRFYEKPSQERKREAARKLRKSRKTTRKMENRRW